MIDLYLISFHWSYILVFFIGAVIGLMAIGLAAGASRSDYDRRHAQDRKRIQEQTKLIFQMRKELVEAKGAASSNELRADCLEKLKNELQKEYDDLAENYKKLYIQLDALKASEVKKFRTPEEIETAMKLENDFEEVLKELSTIEEMLLEVKPKVLLAS